MSRFLFLLVFSIASCSGVNNEHLKFNILPITEVLQKQEKAWNNGDIDRFMLGYWNSDSLKFIGKSGVRIGYNTVASSYKKNYDTKEKMGHLSFSELQYQPLNKDMSLVNVTGKWAISGKDSAGGFFSLIFKSFNGDWKIIIDHTW